uniref:Protein Wnt n=1 Tax=Maylandia zebra TaxID=106582 RepID=A0A3P9CQT6_9CICH
MNALSLLLVFLLISVDRWLGVTSPGLVEKLGCSNLSLSPRQRELCSRKSILLPGVREGARLGVAECQRQFRHERWNCSTNQKHWENLRRPHSCETGENKI